MTTEQFDLSKKIFRVDVGNSRGKHRLEKRRNYMSYSRLYVKDVKEFIRELKEEFSKPDYYKLVDIINKINEKAGKELIEGRNE